jgi:hypothetical protein
MQGVQLIYRAELRRRWRSWIALALLVALAGSIVLASVAAGRRTSSAFPSFRTRYGYDALIYSYQPVARVASLPEVESYVHLVAYAYGNLSFHGAVVPSSDTEIFGLPAASSPPVTKLLAGHLPVASQPTGAVVSFTLAQQFGVRIGSSISVPFSARAVHTILPSEAPPPKGPTVRLTVVGIEADILDFPSGTPNFSVFVGSGFQRRFGPRVETASAVLVRLRDGPADVPRFSADVQRLAGKNFAFTESIDTLDTAVDSSIGPQVVGWDVLALLAGLAALAVVGQAFARQNQAQAESFPTLRAVGVRPRELVWLGVLTAASVGACGAIGALALAWALSPLTPVGVARIAAPSTGLDFDPLVLLGGAALIVMLCIALGFLPAWRSSRALADRLVRDVVTSRRSAAPAAWRVGVGGVPSALVGTRRALQSGTGRLRLPVATALLGSCLAVTALVATAVFGASLSYLSATPSLYGQDWQLFLSNGLNGVEARSIVSTVEADSAVDRITVGLGFSSLDLRGVNVPAAIIEDVKGPLSFPVASGHLPDGDRQIALGESTLHQMGAHLGSFLPVTIRNGGGAPRAVEFEVVGTTVFAPVLEEGGLGVGVLLTDGGALAAACADSKVAATCRTSTTRALEQAGGWGILVSAVPGPAGQAALSSLAHRFASTVELPVAPTELVNFGEAVNFPLLLGIALAIFGAATFTHLLVVSVARRRRDIALVKSIGFVRRQVAAAVCWQASTLALVAIGFGVPVGIALGRLIWRVFAVHLGAVSVDVVPVWLVVLLGAGVLVVANLLAAIPAMSAARLRPSVALRQA